ncbi:hypothetical protein RI578_10110 [Streptomyces sp. BB1-1-1]|nr:hypothetical protein [Streptomyces sp. BB1-1-1]WND34616.1 hypothetical protein RI578_10110 [Streptomyces sp. BB1-1-1]
MTTSSRAAIRSRRWASSSAPVHKVTASGAPGQVPAPDAQSGSAAAP